MKNKARIDLKKVTRFVEYHEIIIVNVIFGLILLFATMVMVNIYMSYRVAEIADRSFDIDNYAREYQEHVFKLNSLTESIARWKRIDPRTVEGGLKKVDLQNRILDAQKEVVLRYDRANHSLLYLEAKVEGSQYVDNKLERDLNSVLNIYETGFPLMDKFRDLTAKGEAVSSISLTQAGSRSEMSLRLVNRSVNEIRQRQVQAVQFFTDLDLLLKFVKFGIVFLLMFLFFVQRVVSHKARQRLNNLIESMTDSVIHTTPYGIITDLNPATETTFEYSRKELVGENIKMLMDEPHRSMHDEYLRRYRDTRVAKIIGKGQRAELPCVTKSGEKIFIDLIVTELLEDGTPIAFVGVVRDVSDQVLMRQQMEMMTRMMTKNLESENEAIQRGLDS